jgi:hypothetical protein
MACDREVRRGRAEFHYDTSDLIERARRLLQALEKLSSTGRRLKAVLKAQRARRR